MEAFFALRLGMAKAYDTMDWSFLIYITEVPSAENFISLVSAQCLSLSVLTRIMNASFYQQEASDRAAHSYHTYSSLEGDSFHYHQKETLAEKYTGMKPYRWAPTFSHLMFADNMFLFGEASQAMMVEIKHIFEIYSGQSRQKVNFAKSGIFFSANVPAAEPCNLAHSCSIYYWSLNRVSWRSPFLLAGMLSHPLTFS